MSGSARPYLTIAQELRRKMRVGELRPRERLDSQNELAQAYGVSQATIQKSLKELEREGLIWAQQGKGRFVADPVERTRTGVIGVVLFELDHLVHPVIQQRLAGIQRVIGPAGYHLTAFALNSNGGGMDRWLSGIDRSQVDGAIIIAQEPDLRTVQRLAHDVPSVWMDAPFTGDHLISVSLDYLGGGFAAARHLLELGHRRIGFVGPRLQAYRVASEQLAGIRLAVQQLGDGAQVVQIETQDYAPAAGAAAWQAALAHADRPTAVICASDELALGVWQACQRADLAIPRGLSLVAWNDTLRSEAIALPLTTVRMDFRLAGERSAQQLLQLLEHPAAAVAEVRIEAELVVRQSTCHPPRGA